MAAEHSLLAFTLPFNLVATPTVSVQALVRAARRNFEVRVGVLHVAAHLAVRP